MYVRYEPVHLVVMAMVMIVMLIGRGTLRIIAVPNDFPFDFALSECFFQSDVLRFVEKSVWKRNETSKSEFLVG